MQHAEQAIQRAIFQHLKTRGAPGIFFFHCPNGGYRRRVEAAILKGVGVVRGIPDVIIVRPVIAGAFLHGQTYALELKTDRGVLSDEQRDVLQLLKSAGAIVAVANGLDAAVRQLEDWGLLRGRAA